MLRAAHELNGSWNKCPCLSQTHPKATQLELSTGFTLSSTNKSINLQQWDPRMLSLIYVDDDTAIAVQRDLNNLECHISVLQLRKSHYQTSITSFFQPSARGKRH